MFDVAPTELLLVGLVALLVIGPKDLPRVMRTVGHWVGQMRGMARHFRAGVDEMIRQSEIEEMEKKWAEENARIMREHPMTPALEAPQPGAQPEPATPVSDAAPTETPPLVADEAPVREGELPFPDKPA
jgi:sec-independent protein translocase protein TatB